MRDHIRPEGQFYRGQSPGNEDPGPRRIPLLPLESGIQKELVLQVGSERRAFIGKIEAILDETGEIFTYAEILKDVTPLKKLKQREQELNQIRREIKRKDIETEMIGFSGAMQKVFDLIIRCSDVDYDIFLQGETGVGKEMAARAIHARSARKHKPFIAVNCGALPEALIESELFGNVKGAFTRCGFRASGLVPGSP